MQNKETYQKMCADFRQANRIVALMQGRIRDIVFYVQSQTKFRDSEIVGIKLFSNELANRNNKNGELKLRYNMWPWDFIYGYVFEYRFVSNNNSGVMSIIQISDDGFTNITEKGKWYSIKNYQPVKSSNSWLIFTYSEGNKEIPWEKVNEWKDGIFYDEKLIAKRYEMSEFYNQGKIDQIICDFEESIIKSVCEFKNSILSK